MKSSTMTEVTLDDVLKFMNGKSIKPSDEGKYPVYGANGIIGYSDFYRYRNALIIGRVGAYCGAVEYCRGYFWPSDNTIVATCNPIRSDIKFMYYMLKGMNLNRYAGGAAQPLLTQTVLKQVPVKVPSLHIQRKIAAILSAYDDLIENNTRRIKILEEMAQLIYREWFVKFRFPGHEKVRMVESELGPIPEGWEVRKLKEVFDIKYGKNLPTSKVLKKGKYPVYGATSIIGFYNECIAENKVVLVSCRGNGSGIVYRTREAAFITNNSLIIRPLKEYEHMSYGFIEYLMKNSNIMGVRSGSAQPQITIEGISSVLVLVPDEFVVREFNLYIMIINEFIDKLVAKNTILRRTRDLLLPKLISGELDVEDLDIAVGGE